MAQKHCPKHLLSLPQTLHTPIDRNTNFEILWTPIVHSQSPFPLNSLSNSLSLYSYYAGSALDPLRSSSRVSNMSMLERPVSKPQLKTAVRAGDLRNSTPSWSSNLIDRDTVRNQSRQMRSRISVRPESGQYIISNANFLNSI